MSKPKDPFWVTGASTALHRRRPLAPPSLHTHAPPSSLPPATRTHRSVGRHRLTHTPPLASARSPGDPLTAQLSRQAVGQTKNEPVGIYQDFIVTVGAPGLDPSPASSLLSAGAKYVHFRAPPFLADCFTAPCDDVRPATPDLSPLSRATTTLASRRLSLPPTVSLAPRSLAAPPLALIARGASSEPVSGLRSSSRSLSKSHPPTGHCALSPCLLLVACHRRRPNHRPLAHAPLPR